MKARDHQNVKAYKGRLRLISLVVYRLGVLPLVLLQWRAFVWFCRHGKGIETSNGRKIASWLVMATCLVVLGYGRWGKAFVRGGDTNADPFVAIAAIGSVIAVLVYSLNRWPKNL